MRIEREMQPRTTIEQFADLHDLTMLIRERPKDLWRHGRFWASFEDCEEKGDGTLIGTYGNGDSEAEAIADYGEKISGKTLVIGAYTTDRKELLVPIIER